MKSIKNQKLTIINRKSKEVATDSRRHTPTITWQIQIRLTLVPPPTPHSIMLKILFRIILVLVAIMIGVFVSDRMIKHREREASGIHTFAPYDPDSPDLAHDDRLVVVNYRVEGSEASRKLDEILANIEIERTFGDRIVIRCFEVASDPAYARERGVDVENFRGHLDFFLTRTRIHPAAQHRILRGRPRTHPDLPRRIDQTHRPRLETDRARHGAKVMGTDPPQSHDFGLLRYSVGVSPVSLRKQRMKDEGLVKPHALAMVATVAVLSRSIRRASSKRCCR